MDDSKCDTEGCDNVAHWTSSKTGRRCDTCRAQARTEARAQDHWNRCVYLRPPESTWLSEFGTPEGKAAWIDEQWQCSVNYWSRAHHEYRKHTEKEARALAARAWARVRDRVRERAPYDLECAKGHRCGVETRCLDMDMRGGGFVRHTSVPRCDRQDSCRDYEPQGPALAALSVSDGGEA